MTPRSISTGGGAGGGILCVDAAAVIAGNAITGNWAGSDGGGVLAHGTAATIQSNTISGNDGGGIFCEDSSPLVRNCIIASNPGRGIDQYDGEPQVTYCDVWGNTGGNYAEGMTAGTGCISQDPLFADAAAGDYRLKSNNGRWDAGIGSWVQDEVSSACLDAGDPTSPFAAEPTPNGSRVNMGYDGNTSKASRSPRPQVVLWSPRGDGVRGTAPVVMIFNVAMQRASVESNIVFSPAKAGTFAWRGRRMEFTPATPWLTTRRYRVTMDGAARSLNGVRRGTVFTWTFQAVRTAPAMVAAAATPTASGAQITLNLASAAEVAVSIRNAAGREIAFLRPGSLEAGLHSLLWNGRSRAGTRVPAGTYLLQVTAKTSDGAACAALTSLRR